MKRLALLSVWLALPVASFALIQGPTVRHLGAKAIQGQVVIPAGASQERAAWGVAIGIAVHYWYMVL